MAHHPGGAHDVPLLPASRADQPVSGALGCEQLAGEHLHNDPDWTPGCWLASYMRMHDMLVSKAREINSEEQGQRESQDAATGQEDVTVFDSLKLLRKEVFALCPLMLLFCGVGVSMVLTVLSFCIPHVQGQLVDIAVDAFALYKKGEAVDAGAVLAPQLAVVGFLMFSSYACEIVVGILFAVCGHTTVTRLRIKLFRNLTVQEIAFYDAHVSGEISSRLINDSAALSNLTQFTTQTLLGAGVKFFGSLIAMYSTHPQLALLATVITPVSTVLVRRTARTVGHYGTVQNHAMAKANGVAIEVLGNIRTVQSNVGETQEAVRFMERLNYYLRVIKGTVYLETVLRFTSYGLSRARDLVVLTVAMHEIITGDLTIGQYTAFAQYVVLYEDGFKNMADIWINFKQTITATGKFVQLLLRRPAIPVEGGRELPGCEGHVTFRGVRFSYAMRPDLQVLEDLNLEARPGDVVALVGESGAGKSTVGRLLQRYYDPTGGHVLLGGVDFKELSLWWLRAQIGVVEQEPVLFDRSIYDNIAYGSAKGRGLEDVVAAAKLANAHGFVEELASGYGTHPGERAARISGGQKQRLAIARAILRRPKVLLLDEATSALDSENERLVQQALDDLMKANRATTFVIAHRLSTIINATKILVLHKGSVIEEGSHEELLARKGKYASFMVHQMVEKNPLLS